MVDACQTQEGIQGAATRWMDVLAGNRGRMEVLVAAGAGSAYDGCFTKTILNTFGTGLATRGDSLLCADLQPEISASCVSQPQYLAYSGGNLSSGDPGLWLVPNIARCRDAVSGRPVAGLVDQLTMGIIVTDVMREQLPSIAEWGASPLRLLVGPAGAGKSTLLALLIRPKRIDTLELPPSYIKAASSIPQPRWKHWPQSLPPSSRSPCPDSPCSQVRGRRAQQRQPRTALRATRPAVRTTHTRGPQRRHRRRLDRQRAVARCVGLHRPWWTALRNLYHPVRVLHVLRCLLGARDPAAGRDDLQLAGTNDPGHPDRPVQRPRQGFNRIVKHIGRVAFGFRTPENQRRRVRWACPPITASAIHQTAAPLLTRMSPFRRQNLENPVELVRVGAATSLGRPWLNVRTAAPAAPSPQRRRARCWCL